MSVYFISARELGMVKIGCAFDPRRRMSALQSASPVELALEAVVKGCYERERELHSQFAEHRVRGEWFKLTPEIEDIISKAGPPVWPAGQGSQRRKLVELQEENRWIARRRQDEESEIERRLAANDIHFPFRAKVDA